MQYLKFLAATVLFLTTAVLASPVPEANELQDNFKRYEPLEAYYKREPLEKSVKREAENLETDFRRGSENLGTDFRRGSDDIEAEAPENESKREFAKLESNF